jgi:NTP pyrophosphatase (non-canonical NTP hydrolase)
VSLTLEVLQRVIGNWNVKTFPEADRFSIGRHLQEEAREVLKAPDDLNLSAECADCAIMLLAIAHRHGFSLEEAIVAKYTAISKAQWVYHPELGYSKRVKPE